jgi:dTDP-4-amino-4,6-dideoxygalactose transaminase
MESWICHPVMRLQPACGNLGYARDDYFATEWLARRILRLPMSRGLTDVPIVFVVEQAVGFG